MEMEECWKREREAEKNGFVAGFVLGGILIGGLIFVLLEMM